jgi:hypothetical protein
MRKLWPEEFLKIGHMLHRFQAHKREKASLNRTKPSLVLPRRHGIWQKGTLLNTAQNNDIQQ